MRVRGLVAVLLAAGLTLPGLHAGPAHAAGPVVQLTGDSADLDTNQFVDDNHQANADASDDDYLSFAGHRGPPKSHGLEGSAAAFASLAATMETPAEPPFPLAPLNDVAMDGTSTSTATATGRGSAVPDAFSDGSFEATFVTTAPVEVFFSGFLHTTNTDPHDSCSSVTVELTGGGVDRHFAAFTGECTSPGPRQKGWAENLTLPGNTEYELDVDYDTEVDDVVSSGEPASMSAAATASLNLAFFPPTARFDHTVSGFTATFDGSRSAPPDANHHIVKWVWTFGDGTSRTTTTPIVTHRYPRSPAAPPTYAVTLHVVDAGGAISPTVGQSVRGTAVSLHVKRKAKLVVTASVAPNRRGRSVVVTLARRRHGRFHVVATHHETLSIHSRFVASFVRAAAGRCQMVVRYPGDKTHLASRRSKTFGC